ncbi:hypothetical protein HN419_07205 [Candidatus Woesearchaeota archaeon]|jgi:hypothetical protein|nr:hypothetical protein [Candidatus Woesearchaeota archaeon]MBT3538280.1 hypothetical protein [Candidatus Woesearchaeota archaeon]MBT4697565.1 hypothetical protein [Candidatus Woesearchaeota archaeon]MBT4717446.1 hypothetical protein [Candidatus Woesearchaeota archaeon]MBT7105949.1 hypothetical protein [Candidatus Woesearchaeota archaeon]
MVLDLFKAKVSHMFASSKNLGNRILKIVEAKQDIEREYKEQIAQLKADTQIGSVVKVQADVDALEKDLDKLFKFDFESEENMAVIENRFLHDIEDDEAFDGKLNKMLEGHKGLDANHKKDLVAKAKAVKVALDEAHNVCKEKIQKIYGLAWQAKMGWEGVSARLAQYNIQGEMKERKAAREVRQGAKIERDLEADMAKDVQALQATLKKKELSTQDFTELQKELTDLLTVAKKLKEDVTYVFDALYKLFVYATSAHFKHKGMLKEAGDVLKGLGHQGFPDDILKQLDGKLHEVKQNTHTYEQIMRREERQAKR